MAKMSWIELSTDNKIIGIHSDRPSQSDYELLEAEATFKDLGKIFNKETGEMSFAAKSEEELQEEKIQNYKKFLNKTQHKMGIDYEFDIDENLEDLIKARKEARDAIRKYSKGLK
jgi:hypothetical protein